MTLLGKILVIGQLPKLLTLSLDSSPITQAIAITICKFVPRLEHLEAPYCQIKDDTMKILGSNLKQLRRLNIFSNRVTEGGCLAVAQFSHLTALDIGTK